MTPSPKHVLRYTTAPDFMEHVMEHYPAHCEHADRFHDAGTLLMIGTFGDPATQGSMAVFTTREAAEAFVADDPFVVHGVVASHEIREWNESYVEAPAPAATGASS